MIKVKEQIANFFTLLNLASGVMAIFFIYHNDITSACICVFAGAVFDFFDGFVARALGIASEMGKQLDSLSDVVTFGVVPGFIAHHLLEFAYLQVPGFPISGGYTVYPPLSALPVYEPPPLPDTSLLLILCIFLIPALIPAFSALRLAKFNIDSRQSKNFRGLPTPPNGLFWASLGLIFFGMVPDAASIDEQAHQTLAITLGIIESSLLLQPTVLITLVIVMSLMLVMPLSLFGFKFDKLTWKGNEMKFLLLLVCIPLVIIFRFAAAPIILLLYIVFSIIHFYILKRT